MESWKVVLSHLFLIILLVVYILFGAVVFLLIEGPIERGSRIAGRQAMEALQADIVAGLDRRAGALDEQEFKAEARRQIERLEQAAFKNHKDVYVRREFSEKLSGDFVWTFPNAILFTTTMLTTVGYGTPHPTSGAGRLFCVFFGLLGIPLMVIVVADLSKFVANSLLLLYNRRQLRRTAVEGGEPPEIQVPVKWVLLSLLLFPLLGAAVLSTYENWSMLEASYFAFISLLTIGLGDVYPRNSAWLPVSLAFLILGTLLTSLALDLILGQVIEQIHGLSSTLLGRLRCWASGVVGAIVGLVRRKSRRVTGYVPVNIDAIDFIDRTESGISDSII